MTQKQARLKIYDLLEANGVVLTAFRDELKDALQELYKIAFEDCRIETASEINKAKKEFNKKLHEIKIENKVAKSKIDKYKPVFNTSYLNSFK
jgi:hypothetical protein